jgi:hypothetical protein
MRERYAELTPLQRARLRGITRQLADLTPLRRERLKGITRERYEQSSPVERERYRQSPYGRRWAINRHGRFDVGRQLALRPLRRRAFLIFWRVQKHSQPRSLQPALSSSHFRISRKLKTGESAASLPSSLWRGDDGRYLWRRAQFRNDVAYPRQGSWRIVNE